MQNNVSGKDQRLKNFPVVGLSHLIYEGEFGTTSAFAEEDHQAYQCTFCSGIGYDTLKADLLLHILTYELQHNLLCETVTLFLYYSGTFWNNKVQGAEMSEISFHFFIRGPVAQNCGNFTTNSNSANNGNYHWFLNFKQSCYGSYHRLESYHQWERYHCFMQRGPNLLLKNQATWGKKNILVSSRVYIRSLSYGS